MTKIAILYNCKSGRQAPQRLLAGAIEVFEASGAEVTSRSIDFEGNPFERLEDIDILVAAGGDGTIGYIVESMHRHGLDLPLGIIPIGTANDFAGMLGISLDPRQAAQQILDGHERQIDCGLVNGRLFVNILSFGLFTTTSQHTPDSVKRIFGRLAYIFEGSRELLSYRSMPLTIESDKGTLSADVVTALIFNGCTAGRIPLARNAKPDDALLDAVFITKRPLPLLLLDILRYLCGGRPSSIKHLRSRHLRITSTLTNIATDTDGQPGPTFPLDIDCLAGDLRIRI